MVPLLRREEQLGVLDVDSPLRARSDGDDQAGLERVAGIYVASLGAA